MEPAHLPNNTTFLLSKPSKFQFMKGINFHTEKNHARAYRNAKCASVCLAVKVE